MDATSRFVDGRWARGRRGYKGTVVSATATHIRMELQAQYKTVTVDRKFLPPEFAGPQPRRAPAYGMAPGTPHHPGSRTPSHGTPSHSWGSATPMHPSMTPLHPGSQVRGPLEARPCPPCVVA
jgi:hypothetical protein